jgi:tyrosinase
MVQLFLHLAVLALCALASTILAIPPNHPAAAGSWANRNSQKWQPCTKERMQVRQDFDQMAPDDRKAYTDAVKCLMEQPSQLNSALYPGAINRFFDYSAIHINRTKVVHLNGFFFTWHRMLVWLYEQDLKNLCGYKGTQPYWNWYATAANLTGSAVFDGSKFSMSGNGIYDNTGPIQLSPTFSLPHGTGGGCIHDGPFAYMNYTMAPIPISVVLNGEDLPPGAFHNQPTCLTRDLNQYIATTQTNFAQWDDAVHAPNISVFTDLINGELGGGSLGLHSGAHFVVGSPASSLFASPQDPVWYPMHAMLDYTFWTWQKNNPMVALQISGTETAVNLPPSANVTLDSYEPDWGYLSPSMKVQDLMNTTEGPFCYRYE